MHAAVYSEYLEVHTLSALPCYQLTPVNNGFAYYEFEYIYAAQLRCVSKNSHDIVLVYV